MDARTIPYTEVSNAVLRDASLSLAGKGLYAMIYSYAGLPGFRLTLDRLDRACASSTYALRKAWRELKAAGYLRHYYTTADNGAFCHAYDISHSAQPDARAMQYVDHLERENGEVRPQANAGDYTQVPNDLLRSDALSLPLKGLYAVLRYLFKIPNFTFRLKSLSALCLEKTKALGSVWRKLKLCGLLKQHRRPSGAHNRFDWTYELLTQPDASAPYFISHRADGSVVTSLTAQHATAVLRAQAPIASDPLQKQIEKALCALRNNKTMKLGGVSVPLADRLAAVQALTADKLHAFSAGFTLPQHVRAPIPYLAAALYQYAAAANQPISQPDDALSFSDVDWALQTQARRIQAKDNPSARDRTLLAQYQDVLAQQVHMTADAFRARCLEIFQTWKAAR